MVIAQVVVIDECSLQMKFHTIVVVMKSSKFSARFCPTFPIQVQARKITRIDHPKYTSKNLLLLRTSV